MAASTFSYVHYYIKKKYETHLQETSATPIPYVGCNTLWGSSSIDMSNG